MLDVSSSELKKGPKPNTKSKLGHQQRKVGPSQNLNSNNSASSLKSFSLYILLLKFMFVFYPYLINCFVKSKFE